MILVVIHVVMQTFFETAFAIIEKKEKKKEFIVSLSKKSGSHSNMLNLFSFNDPVL